MGVFNNHLTNLSDWAIYSETAVKPIHPLIPMNYLRNRGNIGGLAIAPNLKHLWEEGERARLCGYRWLRYPCAEVTQPSLAPAARAAGFHSSSLAGEFGVF